MDRLSALGSPGYEDIAAAARDIGIPIEALRAMIDERMPPGEAAADTLAYRRVSDIEAKPIRWLWPGRIARGKVTVLAGHPGLGKGQAAVSLAAVVTTGGT